MNVLLLLPILIPLLTAVGCLLGRRWRGVQRVLGVLGSAALLAAAGGLLADVWRHGIQSVQMGHWPAPFGITLVADLFSAVMVAVSAVIHFSVTLYSLGTMDMRREAYGYYTLQNVLLMGVCGAFLTGDIFNLYVWFEVMLIASFVLMALGGERPQMEGAFKYVTLNLLSSALFLAAVGILYGVAGTLNLADLSVRLPQVASPGVVTTLAVLFLMAFGIKAAAFPLFFWLPASYHTPPVAVTALFSGLLTKVGVYSLVRVFTLLFIHDTGYTHTLILGLAALTMITGVLGALAQMEMRRLLSFHIVSQIGYLLMGLGLYSAAALSAMLFFMVHVILSKSALFLISGVVHRARGTYDLKKLGGFYLSHPGLATLFLVAALSLGGIPPLSGFFAKLALVMAGLEAGQYAVVAAALGVSIVTLLSMLKIWGEVFWKPAPPAEHPAPPEHPRGRWLLLAPVILMAALIVALGLGAEALLEITTRAGEQLMDPGEYVEAVLGGGR